MPYGGIMMSVCSVKSLKIGAGKPKICIPVFGEDDQEILRRISQVQNLKFDLLELRIDFYQDILHFEKLMILLKQIRMMIEQPILFTYRSKREGGEVQLTDGHYFSLIQCVCESHCVDLIDIELMSGAVLVSQLVDIVHDHGLKVLMSNHDFYQTPTMSELKERFEHMEILGADIMKIAVMPQSYKDVITVLNLTLEMSQRMNKPIVTMAMGELGKITRIAGELTGSSITFASVEKASAPGQIPLDDMQVVLEMIHHD